MRTVTIEVTEDQAKLISHALDFYCRIGLGQFNYIRENYSIQKYILENKRDELRNIAKEELTIARNKIIARKRKITEFENRIQHLKDGYMDLFPVEQNPVYIELNNRKQYHEI